MRYWLMKSEPGEFSIEDLRDAENGTACWDGVRNYQARNFMRDDMKSGDRVLFYHSNAAPPGVAGTAAVVREAYPDNSAWDAESPYFDRRSTPENPVWVMVDLRFESRFPRLVPLARLRSRPELKNMLLLRRGMRLSIQPLTEEEFHAVLALGTDTGESFR
ncbi:MAG: EVE domain-containing protein [Deltaproteobacteria bacterium]|nr:EVE domain-containing protein [Deltaproteobacteria bacterium]